MDVAQTKRELDLAQRALRTPGSGSIATLECRVAGLQEQLLATKAGTLADIEARLDVMRQLIEGLGEPGYLLHLVNATLDDVRRMLDGAT